MSVLTAPDETREMRSAGRPHLSRTAEAKPRRLPPHLPEGAIMSTSKSLTAAITILRRAEPVQRVLYLDAVRPGKSRLVSLETFLVVSIAFKIQGPKRDFVLTDLTRWVDTFTPAQQLRADLPWNWSYDNLQTALQALIGHLEPDGALGRRTPRNPRMPTVDEFVNALIDASIPAGCPQTEVLALDSTDVRTHAKRRSWLAKPDTSDPYTPDDARTDKPWASPGWPKLQPDGRYAVSADLDARIGWCTVKNQEGSSTFNGYDAHLLVDAGSPGQPFWVPYIRGAVLRPAGEYKADAGLALLDSLPHGLHARYLASDRGYSYAKASAWHLELRKRNVIGVHDLHTNQRRPHPSDTSKGVTWIDGTLFPDSLPQRLRQLPNYPIGMKAADRAELTALYEERARWAFRVNQRFDNGDVQLKGPAYTSRIRCRNAPKSMRAKSTTPLTNCKPGCQCGSTRVIPLAEAAWERQELTFGTKKWLDHYGLRSFVEGANAQLKEWRGSMRRHSTKVFGTTANAVVLAIHCAAVNVSMTEDAWDGAVTLNTRHRHDVPRMQRRRPTAASSPTARPQRASQRPPARKD